MFHQIICLTKKTKFPKIIVSLIHFSGIILQKIRALISKSQQTAGMLEASFGNNNDIIVKYRLLCNFFFFHLI